MLTEPVHLGVHSIATASVAFSQRQLNEVVHQRLARLQRRLAEVALVSLALGLVLCFWMALSWTRPIGFLAQMAERIGQGRWRLEWGPAELRKDELGFLARAFHRMADRLRELDQLKEDFVSAVTHELRSPLGAIESYLNLIGEELHEGISPETWQNYLQRLRANTQRLTRFVNDLLDVAALERGKVTLERRSTDALALVREVIDLFAAKLKEKNLSCELEASASLPPVFADADKLRQVLINLVSNAIKFTPEGGHILMKAEALEAKKLLQISVTDTGIGIAEGDQAKIFSKFEQVLTARQGVKGPKGTGLGLAISRMLIEMQGGTLGVHSQLGEGSTFFFTLPLAESGASARAQPVLPKGT